MKSIFFACFLIISSAAFSQDKICNLWIGDGSDSTGNVKLFAEKYLEIQTKLLPAETNTIQQMKDDNDLALIKIWLKPKKVLVSGTMTTVYAISSFKVISLSEKIDALYTAFANKIKECGIDATPMNTVFGDNKMFIERTSDGFGPKGVAMATLTVTAK